MEDVIYFEFISPDAIKEIFAKETFTYEKFSHLSITRKDIVGSLANIVYQPSVKSIGNIDNDS